MHRLADHLRGNVVAYLALMVAVIGGGSYAVAATIKGKTISACASKKTGELFLHQHGSCKRGLSRVTWSQKGAQGSRGATGAAGPGTPNAFGVIDNTGAVASGLGLSSQRVGTGVVSITVTDSRCAKGANAPVVTATSSQDPTETPPLAGAVPIAWIADNGSNEQFTVHTGFVESASFTPEDLRFDIDDPCLTSGGHK